MPSVAPRPGIEELAEQAREDERRYGLLFGVDRTPSTANRWWREFPLQQIPRRREQDDLYRERDRIQGLAYSQMANTFWLRVPTNVTAPTAHPPNQSFFQTDWAGIAAAHERRAFCQL